MRTRLREVRRFGAHLERRSTPEVIEALEVVRVIEVVRARIARTRSKSSGLRIQCIINETKEPVEHIGNLSKARLSPREPYAQLWLSRDPNFSVVDFPTKRKKNLGVINDSERCRDVLCTCIDV